jgi:hypothetical protein
MYDVKVGDTVRWYNHIDEPEIFGVVVEVCEEYQVLTVQYRRKDGVSMMRMAPMRSFNLSLARDKGKVIPFMRRKK